MKSVKKWAYRKFINGETVRSSVGLHLFSKGLSAMIADGDIKFWDVRRLIGRKREFHKIFERNFYGISLAMRRATENCEDPLVLRNIAEFIDAASKIEFANVKENYDPESQYARFEAMHAFSELKRALLELKRKTKKNSGFGKFLEKPHDKLEGNLKHLREEIRKQSFLPFEHLSWDLDALFKTRKNKAPVPEWVRFVYPWMTKQMKKKGFSEKDNRFYHPYVLVSAAKFKNPENGMTNPFSEVDPGSFLTKTVSDAEESGQNPVMGNLLLKASRDLGEEGLYEFMKNVLYYTVPYYMLSLVPEWKKRHSAEAGEFMKRYVKKAVTPPPPPPKGPVLPRHIVFAHETMRTASLEKAVELIFPEQPISEEESVIRRGIRDYFKEFDDRRLLEKETKKSEILSMYRETPELFFWVDGKVDPERDPFATLGAGYDSENIGNVEEWKREALERRVECAAQFANLAESEDELDMAITLLEEDRVMNETFKNPYVTIIRKIFPENRENKKYASQIILSSMMYDVYKNFDSIERRLEKYEEKKPEKRKGEELGMAP